MKRTIQDLFFYTIGVVWEGRLIMHHAWTWKDALAWAACYPTEATVTVFRGLGCEVIARRASAGGV
jgi:hypothetical protein